MLSAVMLSRLYSTSHVGHAKSPYTVPSWPAAACGDFCSILKRSGGFFFFFSRSSIFFVARFSLDFVLVSLLVLCCPLFVPIGDFPKVSFLADIWLSGIWALEPENQNIFRVSTHCPTFGAFIIWSGHGKKKSSALTNRGFPFGVGLACFSIRSFVEGQIME